MSINWNGELPTIDCSIYPSRTKQSFRDEVNINKIIARHARTGMVEHVNKRAPFYGDVSDVASYQEALGVVLEAERLFAAMSSTVRERFANDPAKMVEWLGDPGNLDEAVKLGMAVKRPVAPVAPVVVPV